MAATDGNKDHPMVPVPEAIRLVMQETARIVVARRHNADDVAEEIRVVDWAGLLNRTVNEDVVMPDPGYPDYNASIMDGYAIQSKAFSKTKNPDNAGDTWSHQIVSKVYAGDEKAPTADLSSPVSHLRPAIYITTGAKVPENFDCVVPIEECQVDGNRLKIAA